jgi:hypothetical protein
MSNNKQQTAVEWLMDNVYIDPNPELYAKFQQAKEMEKEQVIDANVAGMEFIPVDPNRHQEDAEQYYNETYGGNK